ncbi:MAG: glutathione S-transferase family protein, partial [Steroidobacteraceae bacterium]
WTNLSPIGLIPAIEDDGVRLADSSVICLYLERKKPLPSIYPAAAADYGQALWVEEYVDGNLASHVLTGLLLQRVFAPKFLNRPTDTAAVDKSLTQMIPPRLAYLESVLTGEYFAGSAFSIADITVASILINFHYAGEMLSAATYPKLHRFLRSVLRLPSFAAALEIEAPAAVAATGGAMDMRLLKELGFSSN